MIPEGNYKPIEGYEDYYLIYDDGRVWSIRSQRFLKPAKNSKGYLRVHLCVHNTHKIVTIHRLVAKAFIPNPNNFPQINHIDENKTNNNVANLEWCTTEYNINYGNRSKRMAETRSKPVICIETNITYPSIIEAERQTGINNANINRCCRGKLHTAGGYHWKYAT